MQGARQRELGGRILRKVSGGRRWTRARIVQQAEVDVQVRVVAPRAGDRAQRAALATELTEGRTAVGAETLGEVAAWFDRVQSIQRAVEVGSVDAVISASELRPGRSRRSSVASRRSAERAARAALANRLTVAVNGHRGLR
ncbi:hypothetical protein GCM10023317_23980 [Actinopolymorpha pittospori]